MTPEGLFKETELCINRVNPSEVTGTSTLTLHLTGMVFLEAKGVSFIYTGNFNRKIFLVSLEKMISWVSMIRKVREVQGRVSFYRLLLSVEGSPTF